LTGAFVATPALLPGKDRRMELDEWLAGVHPRLGGLERVLDIDFSRRSLVDLERIAGENDDNDAFAAYLGETLLRVGGGRWTDVEGAFAVTADPALRLAPAVPAELIDEPGLPTGTYDEWAAAAAAHRASDPGWAPAMEPTPGFGPQQVAESAVGHLARRPGGGPPGLGGSLGTGRHLGLLTVLPRPADRAADPRARRGSGGAARPR
jgi:hypothetical protein